MTRLPHLTIAYFTNRPDPKIKWFIDSLHRETGGDYSGIKVVIVDFFQATTRVSGEDTSGFNWQLLYALSQKRPDQWAHVSPKPTVWQGPHRLTTQDYFCASNARNTAICHAPDGWIAFVDDLSVLLPGWLHAVREAMAGGYIALGAYKKMKKLVVENGEVVSYEDFPGGVDSRWNFGRASNSVPVGGSLLYGCSLAAPVEAFLKINGFPEICDSLGGEDFAAGIMLEKAGYNFRYDRRMLTYESEEDHGQLPVFKRDDPCRGDTNAKPRDDMSHAMLKLAQTCGSSHPGFWGEGGIRALRDHVLAGGAFPIPGIPEHRWFDGKPLREL